MGKNLLICLLFLLLYIPARAVDGRHENKLARRDTLLEKIGLTVGADISSTAQYVSLTGDVYLQNMYYPFASWELFNDTGIGAGRLDFNYILVRYPGKSPVLPLAAPINNFPLDANNFSQLTYTHTIDWFSLIIGQFTMANFDGVSYLSDQQMALINFSLAQNPIAFYPASSLGAYAQINPREDITLMAGLQDAANITGERIDFSSAFSGRYMTFFIADYNAASGKYGIMLYHQPSVAEQPGGNYGGSINIERDLTAKTVLFTRLSAAGKRRSYALGASYKNPLERNELDAVTIAAAYNKLTGVIMGVPEDGAWETVFEAQWVWGFSKWLSITPDIQIYPKAGLDGGRRWISVFSLRANVML